MNELEDANTELNSYLMKKYGVSNWSKSKLFKFKVCGSQVIDCYCQQNDKYFRANEAHANKQGDFYFGLLQTEKSKLVTHSIGWCESNYNPKVVSPDGGYGIFQITPSVIGDPSIKKGMLLDDEYNTQYALFLLSKLHKQVIDKYQQYNQDKNEDFVQWLTLRAYNGGFRQLDRLFDSMEDDQLRCVFSGDYIRASNTNGRFVCYEKVNTVYPLKIYRTIDTIRKKAF